MTSEVIKQIKSTETDTFTPLMFKLFTVGTQLARFSNSRRTKIEMSKPVNPTSWTDYILALHTSR